ncbi:phosphatase PAP2 family protein [Jiangella rhizosphaerae]|uniref:Inositol phosphorylceramide synthase n=1 Tax=Jiangella rhizosphaerae TaxID=2293569 RepID=A0A418KYU0_9ACTN|nr:phosphatase PAP2 family protein [Jiangella rhizosphaerae]RIQ37843.1 inositol phosphorylceramide synthase [Jiangella rhizosphaerae]
MTDETEAAAPPGDRWRSWVTPGRVCLSVYLVVLLVYCAVEGIPMDRVGQTGWIIAGMIAIKIGRPWREHVRTFLDWLPLLAALIIYDHTRGIADTLGMPLRVGEVVDIERWLFGDTIPTVWLQQQLFESTVRWWDVGAAIVYFSHFVVPWVLAAAFYMWSRPLWVSYIRRVLLLTYAGLLTYVLLPAAPPWYASARTGDIDDPVYRLVGRGWNELGLRSAHAWLSDAQGGANEVAALPSLHAGFAMLVAVTLWPLAKRWWLRVPVAAYPLAMAFTLVYGGEHYVVDVLLGWLYVAAVMVVAHLWERWRQRRRPPVAVALSAGTPAPIEPAMRTDPDIATEPNEPAGR